MFVVMIPTMVDGYSDGRCHMGWPGVGDPDALWRIDLGGWWVLGPDVYEGLRGMPRRDHDPRTQWWP